MNKLGASAEIIIAAQSLPGVVDCGEDETDIYRHVKKAIWEFEEVCTQEALSDAKPFLEYISKIDKACRYSFGGELSTERYCCVCNIPFIILNVKAAGVLCRQCREDLKGLLER